MRWLMVSLMVVVGLMLLVADEPQDNPKEEQEQQDPLIEAYKLGFEIRLLFEKASFINLANALHLTEEQMRKIIKINEEFRAEAEKVWSEMKEKLEGVKEEYAKWIEVIKECKDDKLPEDKMRRAGAADVLFQKYHHKIRDLTQKYAPRLDKVFTDAQIEVIETFKPCLVPPKNLRDPVRAGQSSAGENEGLIRGMRRLRSIKPKWRQGNAISYAAERFVEVQREKAGLTEDEQDEEYERIVRILKKACAMDDADFELNKNRLVEELIEGSAYEKLKKLNKEKKKITEEMAKIGKKRRMAQFDRIVKYFLNPVIVVPIFKERLGEEVKGESKASPKKKETPMPSGCGLK